MRYRKLGRTGLSVSEIGLGTAEIGMDYGLRVAGEFARPSEVDAIALVHEVIGAGVNFIDTARAYGVAEEVLGKALKGRRDRVILCTKCGRFPDSVPHGLELRRVIREEVEASLGLLQTDCVDIMMAHTATEEVINRGEVITVLEELRQEGKLRFIGAATYGEKAPLAAIKCGGWDVLEVAYSLLDQSVAKCVLPLAAKMNVGIIARSILYRGVLTELSKRLPPNLHHMKPCLDTLAFLEQPGRQTLAQAALRFVLSNPAVSVALIGMRVPAHLQEALPAAGTTLTDQELDLVRELAPKLKPGFPLIGTEPGSQRRVSGKEP
jgi:aryl-alcohol dehydrogenase-like predicted oxidoreductase